MLKDKGSKRRLKHIHWKSSDFSLVILPILAFSLSLLVYFGELQHAHPYAEPLNCPQVKSAAAADR